jgi:formylglycine-generating enzyme required for sulfatase activity
LVTADRSGFDNPPLLICGPLAAISKKRRTINMRQLFLLLILTSCSYKFPTPYRGALPTSTNPGAVSTSTSLSFNDLNSNSFIIYKFDGYLDSKVVGYKLREDTVNSTFFQNEMRGQVPFGYGKGVLYPGTVWVSVDKLIDEIEITNLHWTEFLYYMERDSSESVFNKMLPDNAQLPKPDYFTNPFFRFYPVVGITHEQAEFYCLWRTGIVNELNKRYMTAKGITPPKKFTLEFRLPTEKEWETYAACGINTNKHPQGVKFNDSEIRVNPKAANYLKLKNGLTQSTSQIKNDIKEFNKKKERLIMFNIDRENAPYFLTNKTPFYVFDLPINNYGLYNMIGNVAELVKEKGITKGGSYRDKLEDCSINKKQEYTGASPTVGFRTVCEIKYVE